MFKPNIVFDEVYCINLERRQDRWEAVNKKFKREGIIVTKITGVDGATDIIQNEFKEWNKKEPKNTLKTPGAYAILLTYIKLYEDILAKDQKQVLIFEDDILFHKHFSMLFHNAYNALPDDWKFWALCASQMSWNSIEYVNDKKFYRPKLPDRTYGLFAHAIKSSYIEEILPKLKSMLKPADIDIYINDNGLYVSNPFICAHSQGYSDNVNIMVDNILAKKPGFSHRLVNKENYH